MAGKSSRSQERRNRLRCRRDGGNPPETRSEPDGEEDERQVKEVLDAEEFVPRLPHGAVKRAFGVEAVFGSAELVDAQHGEPLDG